MAVLKYWRDGHWESDLGIAQDHPTPYSELLADPNGPTASDLHAFIKAYNERYGEVPIGTLVDGMPALKFSGGARLVVMPPSD